MCTQAVARSPLRVTARNSGPASRKRTLLPIMFFIAPLAPLHLEDALMSENGTNPMHRREFIQAGAAATAAATLAQGAAAAQVAGEQAGAAKKKTELPPPGAGQDGPRGDDRQRGYVATPDSLDRLLRYSFLRGVRYFDTAAATIPRTGSRPGSRPSLKSASRSFWPPRITSANLARWSSRSTSGWRLGNRLYRSALLPRSRQQPGRLAQEQGDESGRQGHQKDRQGAVRRRVPGTPCLTLDAGLWPG